MQETASPSATLPPALSPAMLLAAIVDSSDDAIISKDLQGIVTSWNRGAERIFGYTASEMIGQPIIRLLPPDRLHEEAQILQRLQAGERVDHYQTIRVRKGGETFHASLTISPLRDETGRVIGASKVARDISREMRAIEQLALANSELRRADRMKAEFLATISHELRTPLNSIIGFAAVLQQGRSGPVTDAQQAQLALIHTSGKHLLQLVNDLLDVSRIEADRLDIAPEEFAPGDVVLEAARTLQVQVQQKGIELRCDIETADPVFTDRQRLLQVVLNLIGNAVKFTHRGAVEVRVGRRRDQLVVSVADTGIGISAADQELLFRPFSQVEGNASRRFEGTGLGLYLCRKIVGLLGGDIGVASVPARGSVFTFTIPARYALPSAGRQHAAEGEAA